MPVSATGETIRNLDGSITNFATFVIGQNQPNPPRNRVKWADSGCWEGAAEAIRKRPETVAKVVKEIKGLCSFIDLFHSEWDNGVNEFYTEYRDAWGCTLVGRGHSIKWEHSATKATKKKMIQVCNLAMNLLGWKWNFTVNRSMKMFPIYSLKLSSLRQVYHPNNRVEWGDFGVPSIGGGLAGFAGSSRFSSDTHVLL